MNLVDAKDDNEILLWHQFIYFTRNQSWNKNRKKWCNRDKDDRVLSAHRTLDSFPQGRWACPDPAVLSDAGRGGLPVQSASESCSDPAGCGEGGARRAGADHRSSGGGAEVSIILSWAKTPETRERSYVWTVFKIKRRWLILRWLDSFLLCANEIFWSLLLFTPQFPEYFYIFGHTPVHNTQTSAHSLTLVQPRSNLGHQVLPAGLISKWTWLRDRVTIPSIVAEMLLHSQWLDWNDLTLIIHMHRRSGRARRRERESALYCQAHKCQLK